jgi:molybdate transport system substrate-binding protein
MRFTLTLFVSFALAAYGTVARGEAITVAAAISLKDALADVAKQYKADTGRDVAFTFASSGQLMVQVRNGAPIDVFISAAERQMNELAAARLIDERTRRVVAGNELVLVVPADAKSPPTSFKDLADPRHKRVALGDPRTVPAGEYAAQALDALKLADAVRGRAVYGVNVRQVLDYVERGEVAAGVVYATDARAAGAKVRVVARADAATHAPIVYPAAVVSASKRADAARRFLDYLAGATAQKTLAGHGFVPPPATPHSTPTGGAGR